MKYFVIATTFLAILSSCMMQLTHKQHRHHSSAIVRHQIVKSKPSPTPALMLTSNVDEDTRSKLIETIKVNNEFIQKHAEEQRLLIESNKQ